MQLFSRNCADVAGSAFYAVVFLPRLHIAFLIRWRIILCGRGRMHPNHSTWTNKEVAAMPATNTTTPTETKQTAEQIPQPKEPTKGFDPDSIRAFLKKLTQKK